MFSQLNFANKSDAVKFYKEYRCTPNKVFFSEKCPFNADKRGELESLVKEINEKGYADILHELLLPFIERYLYARDGVFGWNFRLKRILLDDIIRQDPLLGLWASEKDVLQVVEEWNENIEDSSSSSWRFLCMMECMVKTGYKTDWDDLRQKTCHIAERGSVRKLSA